MPPLLNRPLLLYFVVAFGSMTCFYLLLSVVPLYATAVGAGRVGAGMTTAVLMLATRRRAPSRTSPPPPGRRGGR